MAEEELKDIQGTKDIQYAISHLEDGRRPCAGTGEQPLGARSDLQLTASKEMGPQTYNRRLSRFCQQAE